MEKNREQALRELLGPEYSAEELQKIAREVPELADSASELQARFRQARSRVAPGLSADFTARVMAKIARGERVRGFWRSVLSPKPLAWASVASAVLVVGLWLGLRSMRQDPAIALSVSKEILADSDQAFRVRFNVKAGQARSISVAGDFNYWRPVELKPSAENPETLTVEVPVREGAHAYAFLVDGKSWQVDPSAEQKVEDGFGQSNSILNL